MDEIPREHLKIEIIDPDGPGGQKVYPRPMNVRITHLPTGTVAEYGAARSQHLCREIAFDMLLSALTHPRSDWKLTTLSDLPPSGAE